MRGVAAPRDEGMREIILKNIDANPEVFSHDINVAVEEGVVTLTGFVHSYFEKLAAENVAKSAPGVLGVANDIQVKLGSEPTDPELAREAVKALSSDPAVHPEEIAITVKNRFVVVEGTVHQYCEKCSAERALSSLRGVKGVTNRIEIR